MPIRLSAMLLAAILLFRPEWLHLLAHTLVTDTISAILIAIVLMPWVSEQFDE